MPSSRQTQNMTYPKSHKRPICMYQTDEKEQGWHLPRGHRQRTNNHKCNANSAQEVPCKP